MIFLEVFQILASIRLGFTFVFLIAVAFNAAKRIAGINGWLPILECFLFAAAAFAVGIFLLRNPLLSMYRKTLEAAEAIRAVA